MNGCALILGDFYEIQFSSVIREQNYLPAQANDCVFFLELIGSKQTPPRCTPPNLEQQVQRLEKEFSALKGRGGEARTQAYDKGKAEAINDILGVADNFERAAGAISAETDGERAVVAYYKDAYDNMMTCLEGLGLAEVETVRMERGRGSMPTQVLSPCASK